MMKTMPHEEDKIMTSSEIPASRSGTHNSSSHRSSYEPPYSSSSCDNIKAESDKKVLQGFLIAGIKQFYQDKLERKITNVSDSSKIVFVKEVIPELVISDGEWLIDWRIDPVTKRESDFELKDLQGKYLKLTDWSYTVKMESLLSKSHDYTKILINIKKFKIQEDFTLTCKKNVKFQKFVWEYDEIQNLIRYTKHKIWKSAVSKLDPEEVKLPSLADVNPKENQDMVEIKSVLKIKPQTDSETFQKITGFSKPTKSDLSSLLSKLPPLEYSKCPEVATESEITQEEQQLSHLLESIPNGLELANLLASMYDPEPISQINQSPTPPKSTSISPPISPQKENIPAQIDGYSLDELEDCVESDDEFQPKSYQRPIEVTPKDVIDSRKELLKKVGERVESRHEDRRKVIKDRFTQGITKQEWEKFRGWYQQNK